MSTDLRERVARAISRTRREDNEGYWKQYLPEADAVLAELGPELAIDKLIRDTHKAGGSAELRVTVQADGVLHVLPQHGRPPMADLDKAIAAFRESIREGVVDWQVIRAGSNLLAALDAARGEAVAWRWPRGGWADGTPWPEDLEAMRKVGAVPQFAYAAPPAALAVPAEPIGWVFQHEDTGRMTFCANDGINTPEVFQRLNPRHVLCGPAYTQAQQPAAAVPEEMPQEFGEWFCRNYPGDRGGTVIFDPKWHAPRIWRIARHAMLAAAARKGE